jgi:hypothetical protein
MAYCLKYYTQQAGVLLYLNLVSDLQIYLLMSFRCALAYTGFQYRIICLGDYQTDKVSKYVIVKFPI